MGNIVLNGHNVDMDYNLNNNYIKCYNSMAPKRKILIDTDAGVDDAQAILMALNSPDIDVIGITCVAGNTGSRQVGRNVLRVLQLAGKMNVSTLC